jgi:agmatine deiminase
MPAEWEPHEATWLGWPHNENDWPGKLAPIPWVYGEIMRRLTEGERVRLITPSLAEPHAVMKKAGVDAKKVDLLKWPSDRGWTRDSGPIFVGPRKTIARFRFNAWAKYPNWKKDDQLPVRAAKKLGVPLAPVVHRGREVVLEGGSIDVNGRGTLITTEECLLDPKIQVRNPGFARGDYESVFREALGVTNVIWLGKGIAGDDTHGHVDDLCRFVSPKTIVIVRDKKDRHLEENRERLRGARLEDGSRPEIVELPCPAPLFFDGQRLPASYANFYIANACVLVPTFNDPNDRIALGTLASLFRRPVVGIHAVDLVWGLGTLHCLTQQEPR